MKLDWNRKYTTIAIYAFLVIAAGLLFQQVVNDIPPLTKYFGMIGDLLMPFAVGGALAYILNPVLNWIEWNLFPLIFRDKVSRKARRSLSVLLSYLFLILVIGLFGLIVLPQIYDSVMSLIGRSSTYVQQAEALLNYLIDTYGDNELVSQVLQQLYASAETIAKQGYQLLTDVVPMVADWAISLTNSLFDAIMGLIISVYVLLSKETFAAQIKKLFSAFFKKDTVETILSIAHDSNDIFCGFISGKIVDSFIIGVLCFVGTTVMNMPYAMLVSVIVGVTNVIPYFGPFIGAIPSIFLIMLVDPMKGLYFAIFILLLQQLDGNVIGPKILGDSTGLTAFWVVFSVTFFGGLFGFVGMLIGVPTFAVIYSLIRRLAEYCLRNRGLETETSAYASAAHPLLDSSKKPKKQKNAPPQKGKS
ncbi:MAG: AI-2E family transporter [Oscillospiraceae bacterium]|nr:AI-2E family transporter [Oscillospiraceae bacterium]